MLGLCRHVGSSPVAGSRGHPLAVVRGSHCRGLPPHGARAQGCAGFGQGCDGLSSRCSRARQLRHMGLVAQLHGKSSWTRYQTRVSCIDGPVLYHWAIGEASGTLVFKPSWRRGSWEWRMRVWLAVWRQSQGSVLGRTATEAGERERGREVCGR